jgi:hypothetical protein
MNIVDLTYNPTPKQMIFHTTRANEVLYGGAAGGGKEISVDTLIPTDKGFVRMGDLQVGDRVFGLDGQVHKVLKCSVPMVHDAWRFIFDD